ncbi:MAG: YifB family Mg chelatase-like AAA ATPase [Candidatus Peregrinibacteria bacterium]
MVNKVFSCSFTGLQCRIIEVQADISNGLPSFSIVGLGDASVQESKERVRSGIKNSGAKFPPTKKTINLAPAQVRKQGSLFDLPIAAGILLADKQIYGEKIQNSVIIGELSLTGKVKRISGALPITQHAKEKGFSRIFLPKENALEASFIEGIDIYPVDSLWEFIGFCKGTVKISRYPSTEIKALKPVYSQPPFFESIVGLETAKRGLLIAAAGGHNVLLTGSPGCGKTVLCRAFQDFLPQMNRIEMLETTKTYSIAGLLDPDSPLIMNRPFREVHHTGSMAAIIGGGGTPRPGEVSLAHNGVLFFDEIAEFPQKILEALRTPLEDKFINISRSHYSLKFPSNFIFIATMNPCPCGYGDDKKIKCICSPTQVKNYQRRLSGPLLDRFDIFIKVEKVPMGKIFNKNTDKQSRSTQTLITQSQKIQNERFTYHENINKNADMSLSEIKKHCVLSAGAQKLLNQASKTLKLSNRGYLKTLKISRTIADLDGDKDIQLHHLAEAIQFRRQN